MKTVKNHGIYLLLVLVFLAVTPAVEAEKGVWDAPKVLNLSDELYLAARRLKIECRRSPPKYLDEGTSGHIEFRYHVNHFASISRDLSQALENGKSKKETQPIYNILVNVMIDLERYAGREVGGAWRPVSNAVLKANGYLTQLGEYYSKP